MHLFISSSRKASLLFAVVAAGLFACACVLLSVLIQGPSGFSASVSFVRTLPETPLLAIAFGATQSLRLPSQFSSGGFQAALRSQFFLLLLWYLRYFASCGLMWLPSYSVRQFCCSSLLLGSA